MRLIFKTPKTLFGFLLVLYLSACTTKDSVQPIELDKPFTSRVGQSHITPDRDFTFRISKVIADIRNDAATIVDVQLEYSAKSTNGLTEYRNIRANRKDYFGPYTFEIIRVQPRQTPSSPKNYNFKIEVTRNNFLTVDCSPFYFRTEAEEVLSHTECGTIDDWGLIRINRATLDTIDFDQPATKSTPAKLWCLPLQLSNGEKLHVYLNQTGLARSAYYHHGPTCGRFSESGLAKTYIKGKVAFFDAQMRVQHQTHYVLIEGDIGCTEMPEKYYPLGDEHFEWRGGACANIDRDFVADGDKKYGFEYVPSAE